MSVTDPVAAPVVLRVPELGDEWAACRPRDAGALAWWNDIELQRRARTEPESVLPLYESLLEEQEVSPFATRDVVAALGRLDAGACGERLAALDGDVWDDLPTYLGCHDAGLDVDFRSLVDRISAGSYRLPAVFVDLVSHSMGSGDAALLEHLLARCGAHRWQVSWAAGNPMRSALSAASPPNSRLL